MRPAPFKGNIIIWNMPDDFTEAQLAALFDEFGLVLGAKIDRFPYEPGRTARGLVDLAPAKAIDAAIEALDGSRIDASKLKVRRVPDNPAQSKKPRPVAASPAKPAAVVAQTPRPSAGTAPLGLRPAAPVDPDAVRAPVAPRKPVVEYRSLASRKIALTR